MDTDDLLKIVLVLVIVWLVLEIFGALLEGISRLFGMFGGFLGVVIVVLIVLFLLDRI